MRYIIGVDGGGTKTSAALADESGRIIRVNTMPGCNPNDLGFVEAKNRLFSAIQSLGAEKSEISAVFCGVAGITASDHRGRMRELLESEYPDAVTDADHDGINAIYAAFPDNDGAAVICGTGSSCFLKKGNDIYRIGGYGKFDCAGNGYEIGKSAIAHALRCIDGRDRRGYLCERICGIIGGDPLAALADLIKADKRHIASFAPAVFDAYEHGDEYAISILNTHLGHVAGLIIRAAGIYGGSLTASLTGGIAVQPVSQKILRSMMPDTVTLTVTKSEPVCGAVAKAKSLLTEIKK